MQGLAGRKGGFGPWTCSPTTSGFPTRHWALLSQGLEYSSAQKRHPPALRDGRLVRESDRQEVKP